MESLTDLSRLSLDELEALFTGDRAFESPRGCFQGKLLRWLESPESRHRLYRPITALMFQHSPFGVDFDERCWFFWSRRLKAGRFEATVGPSRWRSTQAIGLRYDVSGLPGPIRSLLYDEVKPLSDRLCIGIGGLNLTGDPGEIFFFGLEKSGN